MSATVEKQVPVEKPIAQSVRERVPGFLFVGAAYVIFLTVDQMHWWQLRTDYSFGWLVPLFAGYVLWERWPQLRDCTRPAGPSPLGAPGRVLLTTLAGVMVAIGLAVFALGALYRASSGITQPGSLALAAGFACLFPAMAYLGTPDGGVGRSTAKWSDARWRAASLVLFPALVWLISAPLVSAVENAISLFLLRKVVVVVFSIFGFLGYPLVQEGNVLMLPRGQVGVADACSGIRSLTGCLFAGSFLAAVFLDRFWKKALLVAAAMGFAFFTNLLRSLFLTAWAYAYGSESIEGTLHDATGFAVLGLTCLGLFALLPLFNGRNWQRWLRLSADEPATGEAQG
jgi:exosortase/archaeosortase family protein